LNVDGEVPGKLLAWANERLAAFQAALDALAAANAAEASGIAPGPALDRWDELNDGWA
jgi:hypothetical protein